MARACYRCSQLLIENGNMANDIHDYVESTLKENGPLDEMLGYDKALRDELIDTLTSRAHGKFHWASLQLRLIVDQTTLSGIRNALESVPNDISGIVSSAFSMINLQDQDRTYLAIQTLALLTAAKAPLTPAAVCHALATAQSLECGREPLELNHDEIPNPIAVVECCMGLIFIDPTTKNLTLAHKDIAQYIRDQWHDFFGFAQISVFARICIAYLSLTAFSVGPCVEISALSERVGHYPFLDYASHFWGIHASDALLVDENLNLCIKRLLEKQMNIQSALQISCMSAEDMINLLDKKYHRVLMMDAEDLQDTSSLQIATRYRMTRVVRDMVEISPEMISQQDLLGISPLHEAAQAGLLDIVEVLLDAGAQASLVDNKGKSPLHFAAENGHFDIALILVSRFGVIRSQTVESPVVHAARNGHRRIVSLLEDYSQPSELEEAFCVAVAAGKEGVAQLLLRDQISPNTRKDGTSAIMLAIRNGHQAIVQLLLKANASLGRYEHAPSDDIPLHHAIKAGHIGIAKMLLCYDSKALQVRDNLGRNALFEAVNLPDTAGADALMQEGINISCRDFEGNTVLHGAAQLGSVLHTTRLLDQGIDINLSNYDGRTPLHLAIKHEHHQVAALLTDRAAAGGLVDKFGYTPMMYAASSLHTDTLSTLLQLDYDCKSKGKDEETALTIAVSNSNSKAVSLLLKHGADPNLPGRQNQTPLMLAISAGNYPIATLLLYSKADPNVSDSDGRTPLMAAALAGTHLIAELLLKFGADLDAKAADGKTALMLAEAEGHAKVIALLKKHGAKRCKACGQAIAE